VWSALIALIVASGAASGAETAYFSLDTAQLEHMRQRHPRLAALVADRLNERPRLLLLILVWNNLINVAYFAIVAAWAGRYAEHPAMAGAIAVGALVGLILCGEIVPKVIASSAACGYAQAMAPVLWLADIVLSPLLRLFAIPLGRFLDDDDDDDPVGADELKLVIERSRAHGVMSELAQDRLIEIVDLAETPAATAMTHRVDCPAIRQGADLDEARTALRGQPSPYLLIYDDEDNCVGLVTAQALLRGGSPAKRMKKPLFIPEGGTLAQVLELFKTSRRSAGIVVDEYGGTLGLLTLAHLANELLGRGASSDLPEIADPQQLSPRSWRLPGPLPIDDWHPLLTDIDTSDCTTIGGFVTKMLGAVPEVDDRVTCGDLRFRVEQVNGRRISTIVVEKLTAHELRRLTSEEFRS
jgi:CBS domain containing-hemolysin-like protein